ncbi:MAG TPA: YdeI/OmpD-associated family protein [Chitinophagales bacterium]|nr:YdeI/OmpD-associated family protein [Chitinophagales bacterium]
MVKFKAILKRFDEKGEKTGWTFIEVPAELSEKMNPGCKKSYRVKGRLDSYPYKGAALVPMGGGDFILAVNAAMRKGIGKRKGATVNVMMEVDDTPMQLSPLLMECLEEDVKAKEFFLNELPKSEQRYFSKWIEDAKTEATKAKRIAQALNAFSKGFKYFQMVRALKQEKNERI